MRDPFFHPDKHELYRWLTDNEVAGGSVFLLLLVPSSS